MKFVIAAVFTLALAMGVQSSILPLLPGITQIAGHGLSYTAVSGPLALPIALSAHAPAAVIAAASPPIIAAHAPHAPAVVVAHGAAVPGGAYVAQTRGAVHSAPLPGHISSVANLNVAPAPGTL
ncbi:adult cuticle protein 1-like [Anastrepha obliqua]|uniref:adult cuticle protein 1 n=1 Tax=Anastrepha ludens TaxID=28586 RepID=UPI0023B01C31|nr:adult cuticle protein 1 [Anastrepha ludens]XP_054743971.1 adult cuticle protein 1-like [Anastrepha obliqua]XP_054743994.1 adult cuticle protein 1-like [Anastrepha obliqua]